jgi:Protein of unknown function (DUF2637)
MRLITRFAWLAVLIPAFVLSNQSLMVVARYYGQPPYLAVVMSVVFDGAAIVCASLSLTAIRDHGIAATGPRIAVILLAGLSAFLNSLHASLLHDPWPAYPMYAAPPLVSLALWEFHARYQKIGTLLKLGRTIKPMPVLGAQIWFRHALAAHKAMQEISLTRLRERVAAETYNPLAGLSSKAQVIRVAAEQSDGTQDGVVMWLSRNQAQIPASLVPITVGNVRDLLRREGDRFTLNGHSSGNHDPLMVRQ